MLQIRSSGFHSAARDKYLSSEFLGILFLQSPCDSVSFSEGDVTICAVKLLPDMKKKA